MGKQYQEDLLKDADRDQEDAANVGMVPIIGQGMAAGKTGQARQKLGKAGEDIINDVDLPTFDNSDYGQYSLAGELSPEDAKYETVGEDPRLRGMQMDALQTLIDRSNGAADAKSNAAQYGALDEANQLARSREQAISMDMARKGQTGSGMDAVMRANAGQQAANRARAGTQDAVTNMALEKLAAQKGMLEGAGNVRGQDFQRASTNTDIANRFNMFNTQARNDAAKTNLGARQGINNANVDQKNRSSDRRNTNAQSGFGAAMTKATGRSNSLQGMSADAGDSQKAGAAASAQGYQQGKDFMSGVAGLFNEDE